MLQQNSIVKYGPLLDYLHRHRPEAFNLIKSFYIDSIHAIYESSFKEYINALWHLHVRLFSEPPSFNDFVLSVSQDPVAGKDDLLGRVDDGKLLGFIAIAESLLPSKSSSHREAIFSLGQRASVIDSDEVHIVHVALEVTPNPLLIIERS